PTECTSFPLHSYLLPFFFQAEDGIRDFHVTGVQTCALPIYPVGRLLQDRRACIVQPAAGGLEPLGTERICGNGLLGDAHGAGQGETGPLTGPSDAEPLYYLSEPVHAGLPPSPP